MRLKLWYFFNILGYRNCGSFRVYKYSKTDNAKQSCSTTPSSLIHHLAALPTDLALIAIAQVRRTLTYIIVRPLQAHTKASRPNIMQDRIETALIDDHSREPIVRFIFATGPRRRHGTPPDDTLSDSYPLTPESSDAGPRIGQVDADGTGGRAVEFGDFEALVLGVAAERADVSVLVDPERFGLAAHLVECVGTMGREDVVPEKWEAGGIAFVEGGGGALVCGDCCRCRERKEKTDGREDHHGDGEKTGLRFGDVLWGKGSGSEQDTLVCFMCLAHVGSYALSTAMIQDREQKVWMAIVS